MFDKPKNVAELAVLIGKSKPQTERYIRTLRAPVPDGFNMTIEWSREFKEFSIVDYGIFGNVENLLSNYKVR